MKTCLATMAMLVMVSVTLAQDIDEKGTAKALFMNALDKRTDIQGGVGYSYMRIKGDGLNNSSGIKTINFNYYIGSSSATRIQDTKAFSVLEFTAGKMHAKLPGHSAEELNLYNAGSFDAWYLSAEVAMAYNIIEKKAFYFSVEGGAYGDLLGYMTLEGNGGRKSDYLNDVDGQFRGFNWGWEIAATAGFRSFFMNLSAGYTMKDYALHNNETFRIPMRMRLSAGLRLTSKYGGQDASLLDKITMR